MLELARSGTISLASSPALLQEFAGVLGRRKFVDALARAGLEVDRILIEYQAATEIVYPAPLPQPVCRDPDDDDVLACALAARVDLIVSGDRDLLSIESFRNIPIVTPAFALERALLKSR